ncbi:MAG TPA: 50S ribosomal protein L22 [Bacteroidia bacterium]|jgi:large subunit ribosomal protein L22|nr:50S ribosomal protein L22 [Bacteroidia bacterium]HNO71009.1 50S ribosomal protein L22 [Bacteroidia bacterium]
MGIRKREMAEARKEANKTTYFAKLNNYPTSPRKMRLLADLIRNQPVEKALNVLKFHAQHSSIPLSKLVLSAVKNYEAKTGLRAEDSALFVKEIKVDSAQVLKRFRPAPQGRAYRIRKRSNHVTVVLDTIKEQKTK